MNFKGKTLLLALALFLLSWFFFTFRTDREFIRITPAEGQTHSVVLDSHKKYIQTFAMRRPAITRLGLYLRPNSEHLPADSIHITIFQNGASLGQGTIAAQFIDSGGSSQVRFAAPINIDTTKKVRVVLSVPDSLSNKIRAQRVDRDSADSSHSAQFFIGSQRQDQPLAFQVYQSFRPPFAYQLAILLFALAFILLLRPTRLKKINILIYILAVGLAYLSPLIALGKFSPYLLLSFFVAFISMYFLLYKLSLPLPAILIGAHSFAMTTWFPLHILAGRVPMVFFSAIPVIFIILLKAVRLPLYKKSLLSFFLVFLFVFTLFLPWSDPSSRPLATANPRDIFFDPNQIAFADKLNTGYTALQIPKGTPPTINQSGGWDHFGSYLGLIVSTLALIGVIYTGKKYWLVLLFGISALLAATFPPVTPLLSALPIAPQYLVIITAFAISFFSAHGLALLWRFIKKDDITTILIYTIMAFALFDILNVTSKTLQFNLL